MNKLRFGIFALASVLLVAIFAGAASAYVDYGWGSYDSGYRNSEYSHYVKSTPYSYTESTVEKTPLGTKSVYTKQNRDYGNPYVNPVSHYWSNGPDTSYVYRSYVSSPYYSDSYHRGAYYDYYYSPRWNGDYYDHSSAFYYRASL